MPRKKSTAPAPRPRTAQLATTDAHAIIDKLAIGGEPPTLRVTIAMSLDAEAQRFAQQATTFKREGHLVRVALTRVQGALPTLTGDDEP